MRTKPLLVALLALGLAGCGSTRPAGPGSAASANRAATVRNPAAAQATAQTEFGLLAGGDYGGAWDLWTDAAKQTIGRADFVRLESACRTQLAQATEVVSTTTVDADTVDVAWKRGPVTGVDRLLFVGGGWRVQPGARPHC